MTLTVSAPSVQPQFVPQPVVQQPQNPVSGQPVPGQTGTPGTSPAPVSDQALINPSLQGPPPGGDAERVASQPGQVAFVDGQQPPQNDSQSCNVAITKDGKSNNPLETFTFGGAISSITAAVASLFVGMPSKCYGPVVQPLTQRFEPVSTPIPEWARNPARTAQSQASQPTSTPHEQEAEPVQAPVPVAPLPSPQRPQVSEEPAPANP